MTEELQSFVVHKPKHKYAIVFLSMLNDTYIPGIIACSWTLRHVNINADIVVLANKMSEL